MSASKNEVVLHTQNQFHICEFKWVIENVSKFSRRLRTSFAMDNTCVPEYQLVAKFHERYPEITHVNIGVQRIDNGPQNIFADVEISLVNLKGDIYKSETSSFKSTPEESPHYLFAEVFTASYSKLKFATSFSNESKGVSDLETKGLAGSHGNCSRVFYLPDDVLVVQGVIKIHGCCVETHELPPTDTLQQSHKDYMLADFRSSYEQSKFTDVDLIVDGEVLKAHRFVLCARSPVFRKMFEHETKEKTEGRISIPDTRKPILDALLWFLYTGVVQTLPFAETCELYKVADKYEVLTLRKQCASNLVSMMDNNTACEVLTLADLYGDGSLKDMAKVYLSENFRRVNWKPEWEGIVRDNPGLAAEILQEVSDIAIKPAYLRNWEKEMVYLKRAISSDNDAAFAVLTKYT